MCWVQVVCNFCQCYTTKITFYNMGFRQTHRWITLSLSLCTFHDCKILSLSEINISSVNCLKYKFFVL